MHLYKYKSYSILLTFKKFINYFCLLALCFQCFLATASNGTVSLDDAIHNPEYMLTNWLTIPSPPAVNRTKNKSKSLSLREAIFLALRYNPNIKNAELDRILQRYNLRIANNEFELQYALAGSGIIEKTHFNGVGSAMVNSFLATPELSLKTIYGSKFALKLDNNVPNYYSYTPVLNFSFEQPLLRDFGKEINKTSLLNAYDSDEVNKLNLKQTVIDQISQVINYYRALIVSANNLKNQRLQLKEAKKTYEINEKKIKAGQLEPTGNIQQAYQIESLNLMVEQADNDLATAGQELLQVVGLSPYTKLVVPSDVELKDPVVPDLSQSIEVALQHNTFYLTQKIALRADERAYKVAKNQQLWQLNLTANAQSGRLGEVGGGAPGTWRDIFSGQNITESVGLSLVIPIHDLSRRNELIGAKVKLTKNRLNLITAKRMLISQITNVINNIKSQAIRYRLAKKQVDLAAKAYELEKKKQQAGISSALDVNHPPTHLINAQMSLISAKISYLNQLSSLQNLLGTTLDHWQVKLRYGE